MRAQTRSRSIALNFALTLHNTYIPITVITGWSKKRTPILFLGCPLFWTTVYVQSRGPIFKNLRKNPKFCVSFSYVYVKFIESYKVKIFTEF